MACMEQAKNSFRVVARKREGKRLLERLRRRWTVNSGIKMNVKHKRRGSSLGLSGFV